MTGNGLAQVLQLLALMLLARIYTPEDFGILAEIQALASILVVFITLQTHLLIPLSSSQDDAEKRLFKTHVIVSFVFVTFLIPMIFMNNILALILALMLGIINSFTSYYVYKGAFSKLSHYYVIRALIMITSQILFGMLDIVNGLLYGAIFGEFFSAIFLGYKIIYNKIKIKKFYILKNINILRYIKERNQFTLYGTFQELISTANFALPLFLFVQIFGDNIGGQFAMANRLVWAPTVLLSSSLAQVYYHNFTQNNKWEIMNTWIWFNFKFMFIVLSIPIFYYFFSDVVNIIFGNGWEIAEEMMFYLLFSGIFFLYSIPYRVSFRAMGKLIFLMFIDFFILLITISLFLIFNFDDLIIIKLIPLVSLTQSLLIVYVSKIVYKNRDL
jgi:O-antigen/teichoic acid export membrane protein